MTYQYEPVACRADKADGSPCQNYAVGERGYEDSFGVVPLCGRHRSRIYDDVRSQIFDMCRDLRDELDKLQYDAKRMRKENAQVTTTVETPPTAPYGRSASAWRRPMVHVLRQQVNTTVEFPGDDPEHYSYADAWCGSQNAGMQTFRAVPDGFEVCQRCAEAIEFDANRRAEQSRSDRGRYNGRTRALLDAAAKELAS